MNTRRVHRSNTWLIAMVLTLLIPCHYASAGTVVIVDENNVDWGFLDEGGSPVWGFQGGPDTPPTGNGSAFFDISNPSDGALIATQLHNGLRLVDLSELGYCTYQETTPQAVALQFNIDYDDSDGSADWQGRLVYEPYYTEAVIPGVWQCWDTLTQAPPPFRGRRTPAGVGNWWSTGTPIVGGVPQAAVCTIGDPCAFSEILSFYPDVAIHQTLGALILKAGSGWPGPVRFNVDQLDVGTQATGVTYDFESTSIPVELLSLTVASGGLGVGLGLRRVRRRKVPPSCRRSPRGSR